jgi:hypothetical protein
MRRGKLVGLVAAAPAVKGAHPKGNPIKGDYI